MSSGRIVGFGSISIDELIYVDRPLSDGKARERARKRLHGGNVATALAAAAQLGAEAGFVGWLGEGPDGRDCADELARYGVATDAAPRSGLAHPIRATVVVGSDGDRFIAYDDDGPQGTDPDLAETVLAGARVLMVDGYAVHSLAVVERARRLGLAVVGDLEWTTGPQTEALARLVDHLVLPRRFAELLSDEAQVPAILAALWREDRAAVVLTVGAEGSYLRQAGSADLWHVPAFSVAPLDTTGAGDCYHGAYAVGLTRGWSPLKAAHYASAAAALSTLGAGGRGALPRDSDCAALLARADAPKPVRLG